MSRLFICEKPSQAADVAKALGSPRKTDTHWETDGGMVTWAWGHLKEADRPDAYNPDWAWKTLKISMLPMIPDRFTSHVKEGVAGRLKEIGTLLKRVDCAIIATDAGREGEVIGREILEHHNYRGRVERAWFGALDQGSLREALKEIRPGEATVNLYEAGKARAKADWLVGMNGTSAVTLTSPRGDGVYSVGRVQTPTLAIVVQRDREIAAFKALQYFELSAEVTASGIDKPLALKWAPSERLLSEETAKAIAATIEGASGTIESKSEEARSGPPMPYNLTDLQADADRRYGFGAQETLKLAQALYETHKVTTYPRTECEYLPATQKTEIPTIWENVLQLAPFSHLKTITPQPRDAIYNTAKVIEHNGIVPTMKPAVLEAMTEEERKLYLMIVGRYVAGLMPDHRYKKLEVKMSVGGRAFVVRGRQTIDDGWKEAENVSDKNAEKEDVEPDQDEAPLPAIPPSTIGRMVRVSVVKCSTSKPKPYTEGTLLKDMEAVAKFVQDPIKKARLNEKSGIGTAATRAAVIEELKHNGYLKRTGRKLTSTIKAHGLIARLEREAPALIDPGETALWEIALLEVAQGKRSADDFVNGIIKQVTEFVATFARSAPPPEPTIEVAPGVVLTEFPTYYTEPSVKSRLWRKFYAHEVTAPEWGKLLAGEVLTFTDCKRDTGQPYGPREVRFNRDKVPHPGVEFVPVAGAVAPIKRKSLL